jgi:hypothetical protein
VALGQSMLRAESATTERANEGHVDFHCTRLAPQMDHAPSAWHTSRLLFVPNPQIRQIAGIVETEETEERINSVPFVPTFNHVVLPRNTSAMSNRTLTILGSGWSFSTQFQMLEDAEITCVSVVPENSSSLSVFPMGRIQAKLNGQLTLGETTRPEGGQETKV